MRPLPLVAPPVGRRPVIRVVAPSGTLVGHEAAVDAGLTRLEGAGCEVRFDRARRAEVARGYLAGTDERRADEVLAALAEPGVEIVWFARGGSGLGRIAEWVLGGAARLPPRHVVGFSDATTLLNALAARLGWLTWHGPVVTSLGRPDLLTVDLDAALARLGGERPRPPADAGPALVSGRLFGGNLTVLASLAGTPSLPRVRGALWLLEDVAEAPYRLDRTLTQLRAAGLFSGARGVWLGDLGLPAEDTAAVEATFVADVAPLPVVGGAPAGHRGRLDLLPLGGQVAAYPNGTVDLGRVPR